jgi:hypothetical protein
MFQVSAFFSFDIRPDPATCRSCREHPAKMRTIHLLAKMAEAESAAIEMLQEQVEQVIADISERYV